MTFQGTRWTVNSCKSAVRLHRYNIIIIVSDGAHLALCEDLFKSAGLRLDRRQAMAEVGSQVAASSIIQACCIHGIVQLLYLPLLTLCCWLFWLLADVGLQMQWSSTQNSMEDAALHLILACCCYTRVVLVCKDHQPGCCNSGQCQTEGSQYE